MHAILEGDISPIPPLKEWYIRTHQYQGNHSQVAMRFRPEKPWLAKASFHLPELFKLALPSILLWELMCGKLKWN